MRREKISERMKFLQDLVPGCSKVNLFHGNRFNGYLTQRMPLHSYVAILACNKRTVRFFQVTGKAVMLDEIINYVQSLQRQVEVLEEDMLT